LVIKERNDIEDLANDLRGECSSLVDELRSVNERYEELLQASEQEIEERRKLEDEIKSWRKKYEGAKTELRNVRGSSFRHSVLNSSCKWLMLASINSHIGLIHGSSNQSRC
jgi:predicted  nucleic acid-binding Zn-ribbon protein